MNNDIRIQKDEHKNGKVVFTLPNVVSLRQKNKDMTNEVVRVRKPDNQNPLKRSLDKRRRRSLSKARENARNRDSTCQDDFFNLNSKSINKNIKTDNRDTMSLSLSMSMAMSITIFQNKDTLLNIEDYQTNKSKNKINDNSDLSFLKFKTAQGRLEDQLEKENSSFMNMNSSSQVLFINNKNHFNKEIDNSKPFNTDKDFLNILEKQFEGKLLCKICYETELRRRNSVNFDCEHNYCRKCVKVYLTEMIKKGHAIIKCPEENCEKEKKELNFISNCAGLGLVKKFLSNKKTNEYLNLTKRLGFTPCAFPDCKEYVKASTGDGPGIVKCRKGHKFCSKCKEVHVLHQKYCYEPPFYLDPNYTKIKICPNCQSYLEKEGEANITSCIDCGDIFCWICLKSYNQFHFSIFNFFGCSGRKYTTDLSKWNSLSFLIFYYFIATLYSLIYFTFSFIFLSYFGYSYIVLKWYCRKSILTSNLSTNSTCSCFLLFRIKHTLIIVCLFFISQFLQILFWPHFLIYILSFKRVEKKRLRENYKRFVNENKRMHLFSNKYTIVQHFLHFFNIQTKKSDENIKCILQEILIHFIFIIH